MSQNAQINNLLTRLTMHEIDIIICTMFPLALKFRGNLKHLLFIIFESILSRANKYYLRKIFADG
jgi:hypothetical protein